MEKSIKFSSIQSKGSLFDKRKLRLSKRAGAGRIPPNWKLFRRLLIQILKKFFFQKGHFLTKRLIPECFIFLKKALKYKNLLLSSQFIDNKQPTVRSVTDKHLGLTTDEKLLPTNCVNNYINKASKSVDLLPK